MEGVRSKSSLWELGAPEEGCEAQCGDLPGASVGKCAPDR